MEVRSLPRISQTVRDPEIRAIYEQILEHPEPSRAALIALGHPADVVDQALLVLHFREVIDMTNPEAILVMPPDVSLPSYAATLERQARLARSYTEEASRRYHRARMETDDDTALVRRLRSVEEITEAAVAIETTVQRSLLAMIAGGVRAELLVAGAHPPIPDSATPVARDVVIDAEVFSVAGAIEDFGARVAQGYDLRVGHNLPFNLLVIDDEVAVVDTTNVHANGRGSLLVRDPILVAALSALGTALHAGATPLPGVSEATGSKFDRRDQLILRLIASGMSDAAIARQTKVSSRTVERRVRAILDTLGAANRFQAGVRACQMGLV